MSVTRIRPLRGVSPSMPGFIGAPGTPLARSLATSSQEDLHQTLQLPDGRSLGFAELGKANDLPVFYFHGYPSTRLEVTPLKKVASKYNLHIIAPDRPGFGLSTFQPDRRYADWPKDVKALADHLNLKRFAVLGLSGGGPFALACAHELPPQMLTAVGLFGSGPPWAAGSHHMSFPRRMLAYLAHSWPGFLKTLCGWLIGGIKWFTATSYGKRTIDNWLRKLDEAIAKRKAESSDGEQESVDQEERTWTIEQRREYLVQHMLEAYVQGYDGVVRETQLLASTDWGFKFEDVHYDKVQIWHGSKDANAPIEAIRYMADRLPHCELRVWDDTHYTIGARLDDVISDLVKEIKSKA